MKLGTPTTTIGLRCRSISLLLQMLPQEVLMQRLRRTWRLRMKMLELMRMMAEMMMMVELTMLRTPTTSVIGRIDSSGRVASLFSLFGVLMPKGEK
jgi:hypothetical protein